MACWLCSRCGRCGACFAGGAITGSVCTIRWLREITNRSATAKVNDSKVEVAINRIDHVPALMHNLNAGRRCEDFDDPTPNGLPIEDFFYGNTCNVL
jgi:hypothetical protein